MALPDIYASFVHAFLFSFAASFPLSCCIGYCCSAKRRAPEEEPNAAALAHRASMLAVVAAVAAAAPVVNRKLGYFPYSAAAVPSTAASGERPMCAICLEEFVHGAMCSEVPACRHFFHQQCIEEWMRSKSTCPLCRVTIVPGSEPLSAAEDMV